MVHLDYLQNHLNQRQPIDHQCVEEHRVNRKSYLDQNLDKDGAYPHPHQACRKRREQSFHLNRPGMRNFRL